MLNQNFIYLSLFFAVIGYGGYIVATYKGKVRPNRISWGIWALAALLTFLSQAKLGGGIQLLYTVMQIVLPGTIFLVSFKNKRAYWKITRRDVFCGVVALTGLGFLEFTHVPIVALWLGIFTDFFASLPTLIKCYTNPKSESWKTYSFAVLSSLITVLTVHPWRFVNYSFAFYVMLINIVFAVLILMHRSVSKN